MDFPRPEAAAGTSGVAVNSPARWADLVNTRFLPLEVQPRRRDRFRAQLDVVAGESALLALVQSDAHRVERTAHHAAHAERGWFKALWQIDGRSEIAQGRNRASLQAGDWTVYDTALPYRVDIDDGARFAVLLLPHERCPEWRGVADHLCGAALQADAASRGALYALLSLAGNAAPEGLRGADAVVDAATQLLSHSLLQQAATRAADDRGGRRLAEARRHVLDNLDDPALGPDSLAAALHVSRRSLFLLFRDHGLTPAGFILDTRLERCRAALADPARQHRTITDIALDHGFTDNAQFSRAFKSRYGVAPQTWRRGLSE